MDSVSDDCDKQLLSADFFDALKFPAATFKSTSVEAAGEGKLKVTGDLTVKDITRPVVLDVTLNKADDHPMTKRPAIGFDATATIKRSDKSEERRAGKEGVRKCRSRWQQAPKQK